MWVTDYNYGGLYSEFPLEWYQLPSKEEEEEWRDKHAELTFDLQTEVWGLPEEHLSSCMNDVREFGAQNEAALPSFAMDAILLDSRQKLT